MHHTIQVPKPSTIKQSWEHETCLTFPKVHGLEHVGLRDAVFLGSVEKLGDLFHLLEGHGRALNLLHRLLAGKQTVNELAQDLERKK